VLTEIKITGDNELCFNPIFSHERRLAPHVTVSAPTSPAGSNWEKVCILSDKGEDNLTANDELEEVQHFREIRLETRYSY